MKAALAAWIASVAKSRGINSLHAYIFCTSILHTYLTYTVRVRSDGNQLRCGHAAAGSFARAASGRTVCSRPKCCELHVRTLLNKSVYLPFGTHLTVI